MLTSYKTDAAQRDKEGLPPLSLTPQQVKEVVELLDNNSEESDFLLNLLINKVEPGVSKAAEVKADWLGKVAEEKSPSLVLSAPRAVELLATMEGGYNVSSLIKLLSHEPVAAVAAEGLKGLIKIYDDFQQVVTLAKNNKYARDVLESWAKAEWYTIRPSPPEKITFSVYKVSGEINTDDFSPGNQAQSRADIPLHATFFGHTRFPGGIDAIQTMQKSGVTVGFAGDVVGTGSSRKSAVNSVAWLIGDDIPFMPNKRRGGIVIGGTIAPIFYATARDAGLLPIECDVTSLNTGDEVVFDIKKWSLTLASGDELELNQAPPTLLDEYRAGGRLSLIIGRNLTKAACEAIGVDFPVNLFSEIENPKSTDVNGFTLAQKMVGRACGVEGVIPGMVCEPVMTTVGSQDTTGPMTMQEIAELACLRFKSDMFMQSFCHTAAYPKASDLGRWKTMTETTIECGGVALKPGDGVIHSWLNKFLVPDTVGTGGDSHTRFPLGISFPAGSGLVAFAAALGFMPLEMPESVLVRFTGKRHPGITVRDMVNAIPYVAIKKGLLTVAKEGKKNVFAGTILEIEGIADLSVDEAFELADASAERSAAACTLTLPIEAVIENVSNNILLLKQLITEGYEDKGALVKRIHDLEKWLEKPELLKRDEQAQFKEVLEVNLDEINQPILACPNDPDDVRLLEEVAGTSVDEVFIGSCMTHLGHHQMATRLLENEPYAKSRLWVAPATRMDKDALQDEGGLNVYCQVGARVEIPGCSLCMGNQARVQPGATVVSTSTRNFNNRLGDGAQVYLGSAELAAITAVNGKLPTVEEYLAFIERKIGKTS